MLTDRNCSAEIGTGLEVGGVAAVFAVSSARDGRGIRPGMAESNGKDSGHSLDLALILPPIQTAALPTTCISLIFRWVLVYCAAQRIRIMLI